MSVTLRYLTASICTALVASSASADMAAYSYHWSTSAGIVVGTNTTTGNGISTGSVAFALFTDGTGSATVGGGPSSIPAASISTTGSATPDAPDSFASPFDLTLRLSDTASGAFGDLTFTGVVNGTLTALTSNLKADFNSPLTQSLVLGGLTYSVTIDPSSVSVPAPGVAPSLLGAQISVTGKQTDPVTNTPEPASLLLAGVSLSLVTLAGVRSRRKRRAASAV